MNSAFAEMFRYNRWANDTLLAACRGLTDEQLDAQIPGISGTVRVLLMHMVGGQQTFVLRTKGRQHEGELTRGSQWPGWDRLLAIASETNDELITIAEGIDAETMVDLPYQGKTFRFPRVFFLVHAMEHGTEHRTEIKVALLQMGIETPDLDGWFYAAAMGSGEEV
jgi:uncharacterized damage-inducible protein DinB